MQSSGTCSCSSRGNEAGFRDSPASASLPRLLRSTTFALAGDAALLSWRGNKRQPSKTNVTNFKVGDSLGRHFTSCRLGAFIRNPTAQCEQLTAGRGRFPNLRLFRRTAALSSRRRRVAFVLV